MQTNPPSVGNNVKLNPLAPAVNSVAYKNGFINLKGVEPSLGIPTGYTVTQANSAYYFSLFAVATSYADSRKFSGNDNLVFVNKNLGYNNLNPTYNIDISGNFHALSAYIENLSAAVIVPAANINNLYFNYSSGVFFNTDFYSNRNTIANSITADSIFTNNLSANNYIQTTIYTIYQLTGAYVDQDIIINGNLTANNVFSKNNLFTTYLSANSAFFNSLTSSNLTIYDNLSVQNNISAKNIFGKINIDPFSQLYYNDSNQLSIATNEDYFLAVRPSDPYSTDNVNVPRTLNGDWFSNNGYNKEDQNVLKPYFKNIQAAFDYIYNNNIIGNNLTIYVDENIVAGENKANLFTPDDSGKYAGCTVTGNLSAGFFSTEWLGSRYPSLTAAGVLGGDFIWAKNNTYDAFGTFSYLNVQELQFSKVILQSRYDLGKQVMISNTSYYSPSARKFTDAPLNISFRTYICSDPTLSYGQFGTLANMVSTWTSNRTKASIQGRQVSFNHNTELEIKNLCFEFNTNANDSTGLVFYDGRTKGSNLTVALLGNGVYTYGALYLNSQNSYYQACGETLGDFSVFNNNNWGNYVSLNGYNFNTPNIYPGYGLAIVGNYDLNKPTIISYGVNGAYTGFINSYNGSNFDITDYNVNRTIGRLSYIQSSLILDGSFNAYCLYQLGDNSRIQGSENIFKTDNFTLTSLNLNPNNQASYNPNYTLSLFDNPNNRFNFRYCNFSGNFSSLAINYYGYGNWAFAPQDNVSQSNYNSYLNVYNNNTSDIFYSFKPTYIDITNSVLSVGHINYINPTNYNSTNTMQYVGVKNLVNYTQYFNLKSPFSGLDFTLNFYSKSIR
jgi:hypothetical protein